MKDGFVMVAAATPKVAVADCAANAQACVDAIREAAGAGAKVIVLPELCLTGYTCADLFWQERLLRDAEEALRAVVRQTADIDALVFAGLPLRAGGKLYNVAAAFCAGVLLGFVPKTHLPAYNEFYETRWFSPGEGDLGCVAFDGVPVPLGTDLLFSCDTMPNLIVAAELCEDLWVPNPPSVAHALAGATLLVNLSASDEMVGKNTYRRSLVSAQSARLSCAYAYATAGEGESSTDLVFGGHNLIAEYGTVLAESATFDNEVVLAQVDVDRLAGERRRMTTFPASAPQGYRTIPFSLALEPVTLTRPIEADPFVPHDAAQLAHRCEEILEIQARGLKRRLEHTGAQRAVVGISGGLDSTLALLVTVRAFDALGLSRTGVVAVTMPGFGTTDRTYDNACALVAGLGATLREVAIGPSVERHFADIGHDPALHDVTYENAQARERTQILMDIANQENGLVVGTGDLSELALGWATYNGDHMSMYAVNAGVPKTLVRHLVRHCAETCDDAALAGVLEDVLATPVSPELLPPEDGRISQKTEDLVGPYELHDFFLYQVLRFGFAPGKVYRLACVAFEGRYGQATIKKWLRTFYQRFFSQQFKRSCLPDGPKVGSVAVSPRGDLRMPSDACAAAWLAEVDEL